MPTKLDRAAHRRADDDLSESRGQVVGRDRLHERGRQMDLASSAPALMIPSMEGKNCVERRIVWGTGEALIGVSWASLARK